MPRVDLIQKSAFDAILNQNSANKTKAEPVKFSDTLKDMINQVNNNKTNSVKAVENFIAGNEGNLHNVMASMEEARLSFQFMLEIRNKLLETYNELMRLSV